MVRLLLSLGAPINARNHLGTTPLMCSVSHKATLGALLEAGADPLILNSFSESAFDLAAQSSLTASCSALERAESTRTTTSPTRTTQLSTIYENQRSTVLSSRSFSASNLSISDIRGPWSSPTDKPTHPDNVHLPFETDPRTGEKKREWYWLSDWHVDPDPTGRDSEGWEYAKNFEDVEWVPHVPENVNLGAWVRRRRWIRVMKRRREGEVVAGPSGGQEDDYLARARALLSDSSVDAQEKTEKTLQVLLGGISGDRNAKRKAEASEMARRLLEEAEAERGIEKSSTPTRADEELPAEPEPEMPPSPSLPSPTTTSRPTGPATTWQLDDDAPACNSCNKRFGFFLRRHHCRWCGKIYCAACTSKRLSFSRNDPGVQHRVDDACYDMLTGPESPLLMRPQRKSRQRPIPAPGAPGPSGQPRISVARIRSPTADTAASLPSAADSFIMCPACGTDLLEFSTEEERESHMRGCFERIAGRPQAERYAISVLDEDLPGRECGICFEEFLKGQRIATLGCLCQYHDKCIGSWLEKGSGCPVHAPDQD